MNAYEFLPMKDNEKSYSPPIVSWLICSHTANDQLFLALTSCLNQTLDNFELIFVANGPEDNEVANTVLGWFKEDPRIRIFSTNIRHLTFSLSLGLSYARGKFIARMDADDISSLNRLDKQVTFMLANPAVAVLGTNYEIIDSSGRVLKNVYMPLSDKEIRTHLFWGNPFCHPSVIYKRDVVLLYGGYMGGLQAEDYDLWVRLSKNPNYKFANLPDICVSYRNEGMGGARRSRTAYASLASAQFQCFISGMGLVWLISSAISAFKAFMRSSKS